MRAVNWAHGGITASVVVYAAICGPGNTSNKVH